VIKTLRVAGLNNRWDYNLTFYEDINVITGKNGSGKTTLLKLLWYLISGNLERVLPEISISGSELVTDSFTLTLEVKDANSRTRTTTSRNDPDQATGGKRSRQGLWRLTTERGDESVTADLSEPMLTQELNQMDVKIARASGASVFFPTFRRIEGGFSMGSGRQRRPTGYQHDSFEDDPFSTDQTGRVQAAMDELSRKLSVLSHHFVASISTDDIITLLTQQYAHVSDQTNKDYSQLSRSIITEIKDYTRGAGDSETKLGAATAVLERIRTQVEELSERQTSLLRPFSVLGGLVQEIFQHKGIQVSASLTLGQANQAIASHALSAGEKQILSFLAYNTFTQESVIFIDEPELSLHVDWQRLLFPILLSQATQNQFVVATHSPFIYSKYADRELLLDQDRGDADARIDTNR
jgi:ABC-type lipoprotein export system ATPase subunit